MYVQIRVLAAPRRGEEKGKQDALVLAAAGAANLANVGAPNREPENMVEKPDGDPATRSWTRRSGT